MTGDAELDELRRAIADRRGLDLDAARFLSGETVDELEGQADDLAKLLHVTSPEPEPPRQAAPLAGLFRNAADEKHRVAMILTGRTQPRDPRSGRFTGKTTTSAFDAGPRTAPPLPPPTHEDWLISVLRERRTTGAW